MHSNSPLAEMKNKSLPVEAPLWFEFQHTTTMEAVPFSLRYSVGQIPLKWALMIITSYHSISLFFPTKNRKHFPIPEVSPKMSVYISSKKKHPNQFLHNCQCMKVCSLCLHLLPELVLLAPHQFLFFCQYDKVCILLFTNKNLSLDLVIIRMFLLSLSPSGDSSRQCFSPVYRLREVVRTRSAQALAVYRRKFTMSRYITVAQFSTSRDHFPIFLSLSDTGHLSELSQVYHRFSVSKHCLKSPGKIRNV